MDRLGWIEIFVAVAEERGFAAAARRLGLSPPVVTRAVAALEAHLGTTLLRRTTRIVRPTPAGERFLDDARRILGLLAEAEQTATGSSTTVRGSLVVTAPSMFGRLHLMPVILGFLDLHPEIAVRALLVDPVVDLIGEGIDVAVRIGHLADSSLVAVRVGAVRRVICGSPEYLRRAGIPSDPAELPRFEGIAVGTGQGRVPWGFAEDPRPTEPRVRLTVNVIEAAIGAALAGQGLVRAMSYQVGHHLRDGALVAVLERFAPPPVPVHVLRDGSGPESSRVRAFVDFAVDALRRTLEAGY